MAFENIFDSSLIDYSSDFQNQDKTYIDNVRNEWYKKIEAAFKYEVSILTSEHQTEDVYGYCSDNIWNVMYTYSINQNGEPFNSAAESSMIDFLIPAKNPWSYLGTLRLIIYVSKPKKKFTLKYNKLDNYSNMESKIIGDPNTHFKYQLIDMSQGYNLVKSGKVSYDIEKITDQLDNDQQKRKYKNNILRKLYFEIKDKSINETIDYILENY